MILTEGIKKIFKDLDKNMSDYVTGEGLTILDGLNQKMAEIAIKGEAMLDENRNGKISKTELEESFKKLEAAVGLGGLY